MNFATRFKGIEKGLEAMTSVVYRVILVGDGAICSLFYSCRVVNSTSWLKTSSIFRSSSPQPAQSPALR